MVKGLVIPSMEEFQMIDSHLGRGLYKEIVYMLVDYYVSLKLWVICCLKFCLKTWRNWQKQAHGFQEYFLRELEFVSEGIA